MDICSSFDILKKNVSTVFTHRLIRCSVILISVFWTRLNVIHSFFFPCALICIDYKDNESWNYSIIGPQFSLMYNATGLGLFRGSTEAGVTVKHKDLRRQRMSCFNFSASLWSNKARSVWDYLLQCAIRGKKKKKCPLGPYMLKAKRFSFVWTWSQSFSMWKVIFI